jgi:hypothetical protein
VNPIDDRHRCGCAPEAGAAGEASEGRELGGAPGRSEDNKEARYYKRCLWTIYEV